MTNVLRQHAEQQFAEEIAAGFREGWAPILSSLKTFLESGKPLPQLRVFEKGGRARFAEGNSGG